MHNHESPGRVQLPEVARRLRLAMILSGLILVGELLGAYFSNSMALLSDAGHVFTDFVALLLVWFTVRLSARPPTPQMTYGYHRWSILAAVVNALSLGGISLAIFYGAYQRWQQPQEVDSPLMLAVAGLGLVANLVVVFYLRSEARENLPVKSAFWHSIGDALSSVGVMVAGVIIYLTGWLGADALVSFVIGAIILLGARKLLGEGLRVLLEAPPQGLNPHEIAATVSGVAGVKEVHDIHLWSIAPGFSVLSAHLSLDDLPLSQGTQIMGQVQHLLRQKYNIAHATLQLECPTCRTECCFLEPCPPVMEIHSH